MASIEEMSNKNESTQSLEIEQPVQKHSAFDCFQLIEQQFSPDSEFDETLGIEGLDEVTVVTIGGEEIIIKRQPDEATQAASEIPFNTIFKTPEKFKQKQRKLYLPNTEINVEITDFDRNVTYHLLNPNLYTITLKHGQFTWQIKRRYADFQKLHTQLMVFKASLNIPFPTKAHKQLRESFRMTKLNQTTLSDDQIRNATTLDVNDVTNKDAKDDKKKKKKGALPRFPNKPDALVPFESIPGRMKQLEDFLKNLLAISIYRQHPETVEFLEVSPLSFISALGGKGKEGALKKRSGSTRPSQRGCDCFGCCSNDCCFRLNQFCSTGVCSRWRNCWFFVKDTFFGYIRQKDGVVRGVGLFDQGFDVSQGVYSTGMRNGIQLYTHSRFVMLKGSTRRSTKEWLDYIKHVASNQASQFVTANPHNSFAPVRTGISAGWFVDGASYMSCVADALEKAQEEIYIADWWLSPEIYMKRPAIDGFYWRLDKILLRKAKQGVKIFVLLYKELEVALGINSFYSKQRLTALHENIRVLRHPDHARAGVFFWAHHEKLVVIDQTYAFVGGIDLCYGRWDDHMHRLTDLGSISTPLQNPISMLIKGAQNIFTKVPGSMDTVDSSTPIPNKRVIKVEDPEDAFMKQVADLKPGHKPNTPEMERRNRLSAVKDKVKTKGRDFMNLLSLNESEIPVENEKNKPDACRNLHFNDDEMKEAACGGMEDPSNNYTDPMIETLTGQAKLWIGKDYCNFIYKDFINLELPHDDFVDRTQTPRMPWHDIATVVVGSSARDVARHFIQRWNAVKLEKARDNLSYPYLMPRTYQEIKVDPNFISIPLHRVSCQVLRSSSSWSAGFLDPEYVEQSIHEAYIDTITKAQHYIYIENQFFISMERGNLYVKNGIVERLYERIMRAVKENKVFRVFVVMPLLPGFEGDVGGTSGNAVRVITHWNYSSINRGQYSLISRLITAGVEDPFQYISFHSLRTHSVLNGSPITELIYVHSKLLICDDKTIICGSANINDRSLIGKRDSEVAVIIQDESFEEGRMNGETFPSGLYAGRLRRFLFREHLGILEPKPKSHNIDINDPISDQFYNGIWRRTSNRNTRIFDEVFKCIPTNNTQSFAQLKAYLEEDPLCKTDVKAAEERIKQIEGYLVDLPLEFLKNEVLTPPATSKEGMMPNVLWV
uniref:Phospholipase n=1 Tax=Culicoides sonorensis TaxID=179676 RepID=A0A336MPQ6_CULSO